MTTYKDVIYMISDLLKISSDDATYTNDHLLFLMSKFRAMLLKNTYSSKDIDVPQSNYQNIKLNLSRVKQAKIGCSGQDLLKSNEALPKTLDSKYLRVWSGNYLHSSIFCPVTKERLRFTGENKYLSNIIYVCPDSDWHLILKSCNPQFYYLESVNVNGLFENDVEAQELMDSSSDEYTCDILDRKYPLEDSLIIQLVEYVAKELGTVLYNPTDEKNDANDNMDEVQTKKEK